MARPPHEVFRHLLHDVPGFWPEDYESSSARPDDEFVFSPGMHIIRNTSVVELVPENESARLKQICEMVIKDNLYNRLTG